MANLSKYQLKMGRKLYGVFNGFNSISFTLVTGNVLSIYAMYLNASAMIIVLLNAFNFLSFFSIPIGRILAKKQSITRIYANAWMLRNSCLLLMLAIPFFVNLGFPEYGIICLLLSNFGFNFFRGIGTIANNPVISDLAPGKDRGSFLVFLSLIWNSCALVSTLLLAFFLQYFDSLLVLNAAIIFGIITGYTASLLLYKLPTVPKEKRTEEPSNFSKNFLIAMHDRSVRLFLEAFMIIGIGVGMARPFIVVYAREVYSQPDSFITFLSFFSTFGALFMGLITRLFIDKIGAKPMYLLYTALTIISLLPTIISPSIENSILILLFLCIIAFSSNLGFAGEENAGQTYFFGLIPKEAVMDLGIVYFLASGIAGAIGSILAGVLLEAFTDLGLSMTNTYRVFFAIQIIIISISFAIQLKLKALDSYSLKEALPLFFSLRDIRGLSLLYKLDRSESVTEKTELLTELKSSNTTAATDNLVELLSSPSFAVRSEAIAGMESLPKLSSKLIDILIQELDRGLFTTAYRAARILGNFKVQKAIPHLLEKLNTNDYILAGESMLALAKIGSENAQTKISEVLENNHNTYITLWGIRAMEMYSNPTSIPVLQNILVVNEGNKAIESEVMLALSSIMGIEKAFFSAYTQYSENPDNAKEILQNFFEEVASKKKMKVTVIPPLITDFLENENKKDEFAQKLEDYISKKEGMIVNMLVSSIIDTNIPKIDSFRFFLCFWTLMIFHNHKLIQK